MRLVRLLSLALSLFSSSCLAFTFHSLKKSAMPLTSLSMATNHYSKQPLAHKAAMYSLLIALSTCFTLQTPFPAIASSSLSLAASSSSSLKSLLEVELVKDQPSSFNSPAEGSGLLRTTIRPETLSSPIEASNNLPLPSISSVSNPLLNGVGSAVENIIKEVAKIQPNEAIPTQSPGELIKTLVFDWRFTAGIALLVLLWDSRQSTEDLTSTLSQKDKRIEELTASLQELEGINESNKVKFLALERKSEELHQQVTSLTEELKERTQMLPNLANTLSIIKEDTQSINAKLSTELDAALGQIKSLSESNLELLAYKKSIREKVELTDLLLQREAKIVPAIKSFLLQEGYIGKGVANMIIPGTIVSTLESIQSNPIKAIDDDSASSSAEMESKIALLEKEKEELHEKIEHSKARIASLHDQLAEVNKSKIGAYEEQISSLKGELQHATREVEEGKKKFEIRVEEKVAGVKREYKGLMSKYEELDKEFKKMKERTEMELEKMRKEGEERSKEESEASKQLVDMKEYMSQLQKENEELKSRLLASDEQLLELTSEMQKKVDAAKEMAKVLKALFFLFVIAIDEYNMPQ